MIEHFESEIGIQNERDFVAVGLGGMANGERVDAMLQLAKNLDSQDHALGHDQLYFDYNQLGGYGLVQGITLEKRRLIKVFLSQKAKGCGVPDLELVFAFSDAIEPELATALEKICTDSSTEFQAK
jgi:hypothetical protein